MIVFDYQTVPSAVKDSNRFCIVLLGESWMMTTARPYPVGVRVAPISIFVVVVVESDDDALLYAKS